MLVLTSRYETFANVIAESLATRTPVVSVDCDFGPREILAGARYSAVGPETDDAVGAGLSVVAARPPSAAEADECGAIAARYRAGAAGPVIAGVLRSVAVAGAHHPLRRRRQAS